MKKLRNETDENDECENSICKWFVIGGHTLDYTHLFWWTTREVLQSNVVHSNQCVESNVWPPFSKCIQENRTRTSLVRSYWALTDSQKFHFHWRLKSLKSTSLKILLKLAMKQQLEVFLVLSSCGNGQLLKLFPPSWNNGKLVFNLFPTGIIMNDRHDLAKLDLSRENLSRRCACY